MGGVAPTPGNVCNSTQHTNGCLLSFLHDCSGCPHQEMPSLRQRLAAAAFVVLLLVAGLAGASQHGCLAPHCSTQTVWLSAPAQCSGMPQDGYPVGKHQANYKHRSVFVFGTDNFRAGAPKPLALLVVIARDIQSNRHLSLAAHLRMLTSHSPICPHSRNTVWLTFGFTFLPKTSAGGAVSLQGCMGRGHSTQQPNANAALDSRRKCLESEEKQTHVHRNGAGTKQLGTVVEMGGGSAQQETLNNTVQAHLATIAGCTPLRRIRSREAQATM